MLFNFFVVFNLARFSSIIDPFYVIGDQDTLTPHHGEPAADGVASSTGFPDVADAVNDTNETISPDATGTGNERDSNAPAEVNQASGNPDQTGSLILLAVEPDEESLPPGWQMARTPEGRRFFINHNEQQTTWVSQVTYVNCGSCAVFVVLLLVVNTYFAFPPSATKPVGNYAIVTSSIILTLCTGSFFTFFTLPERTAELLETVVDQCPF